MTAAQLLVPARPGAGPNACEVVAYKVRGNGLLDELVADGDVIFVRKKPDADDGEWAVVWLADDDKLVVKELAVRGEEKWLLFPVEGREQPDERLLGPYDVMYGVLLSHRRDHTKRSR